MDESVSKTSALDLRGRQSVRAKFRLSEDCIDAISILSAQLGIKQKSIFDHIIEDAQVLKNVPRELRDTGNIKGQSLNNELSQANFPCN
jgi:hypothetical protein